MSTALTTHIVLRILDSLGITESQTDFGKFGITKPEFTLNKKLSIYEDNALVHYSIFAAKLSIDKEDLKCAISNLSTKDELDIFVVVKYDTMPAYGLRLTADASSKTAQLLVKANEQWIPSSIHTQASILSGFEMLRSYTINWMPISMQEATELSNDLTSFTVQSSQ